MRGTNTAYVLQWMHSLLYPVRRKPFAGFVVGKGKSTRAHGSSTTRLNDPPTSKTVKVVHTKLNVTSAGKRADSS